MKTTTLKLPEIYIPELSPLALLTIISFCILFQSKIPSIDARVLHIAGK